MLLDFCRKPEEFLCIMLEEDFLRVVVLIPEENGVDYYKTYAMPEHWQENWQEECVEKLGELFAQVNNELRLAVENDSFYCVVALEGCCYYEEMEFPLLSHADLAEALAWELPSHIPWENDSYEYRFTALPKADDQQQTKIYALPKNAIKAIVDLVNRQEWNLACITLAEAIGEDDEIENAKSAIEFYDGFYNVEQLAALKAEYNKTILLGLAYYRGVCSINFLPELEQRLAMFKKGEVICRWLSVTCLALAMTFGVGTKLMLAHEERGIQNIKNNIFKLKLWDKGYEETRALLAKQQLIEKEIKLIERDKMAWNKNIRLIEKLLPQEIWLTKIDIAKLKNAKEVLMLYGRAEGLDIVASFMQALEKSDSYKNVEMVNSNKKDNVYSFCIKADAVKNDEKKEKK